MTITKSAVAALIPAMALGIVLAGCTAAPPAPVPPSPTATNAPAMEAPATGGPQPTTGSLGVDAADQLLQLRWSALNDADWAAACSMYSEGFVQRLAEVSGTELTDCVAILTEQAQTVADVLADAKNLEYAPLVPYFYVPSSISVNANLLEADSDTLIYAPSGTVTSTDPQVFDEGPAATPGWALESVYIQQDGDGVWRFIDTQERAS